MSEPAWGAACRDVEEAREALSDLQVAVGGGEREATPCPLTRGRANGATHCMAGVCSGPPLGEILWVRRV